MVLIKKIINFERGCTNLSNQDIFCLDARINRFRREEMRVLCCRNANYCNAELVKTHHKNNWTYLVWNGPNFLTNSRFMDKNRNFTTFFDKSPLPSYLKYIYITFWFVCFTVIFLVFLVIYNRHVNRKGMTLLMDGTKSVLKIIHRRLGDSLELIKDSLTRLKSEDITKIKNVAGSKVYYQRFKGIFGCEEVLIHGFAPKDNRSYKKEKEILTYLHFRNENILTPLKFAVIKDDQLKRSLGDSKFLTLYEFHQCIDFYSFLDSLVDSTNIHTLFRQMFSVAHSLCRGARYLHYSRECGLKCPIVHRCIFPGSFYISQARDFATCKISNFQYCVVIDAEMRNEINFRYDHYKDPLKEVPDFIPYAAPEVLMSKSKIFSLKDLAGDTYSLGAVLWEIYAFTFYMADKILNKVELPFRNYHGILPRSEHIPEGQQIPPKQMCAIIKKNPRFTRLFLEENSCQYFEFLSELYYDVERCCLNIIPEHRRRSPIMEDNIEELHQRVQQYIYDEASLQSK